MPKANNERATSKEIKRLDQVWYRLVMRSEGSYSRIIITSILLIYTDQHERNNSDIQTTQHGVGKYNISEVHVKS